MVACPKLPPTCLHFPPEIIFSFYGLSIPVMNSSHGPAAWRRVTQLTTLTGFHWIRLTWKNHPNLGHIKCACLVLSPYQHPSHVIWKILAVENSIKTKVLMMKVYGSSVIYGLHQFRMERVGIKTLTWRHALYFRRDPSPPWSRDVLYNPSERLALQSDKRRPDNPTPESVRIISW